MEGNSTRLNGRFRRRCANILALTYMKYNVNTQRSQAAASTFICLSNRNIYLLCLACNCSSRTDATWKVVRRRRHTETVNHCNGASWFVFSLVRNLMTANEYYLTPSHDRYADLAQGEGGAVIFPRGPINGGQYDEVCPRSTDLVHTWRSLIFTAENLDGWKNASYIGESQNCYKHQISERLRN